MPSGNWATLAGALLAVGGSFVIAATQSDCGGWATALLITGVGAMLVAVYVVGALFVGRGLPDMGKERRQKKLQAEHEAQLARLNRGHALQEVIAELKANERDLRNELGNGRVYGIPYSTTTACGKNSHLFVAPESSATQELVQAACSKLNTLAERGFLRYQRASDQEENDPSWQALSAEEAREREEALEAVQKALTAVEAVLEAESQS